MEKKWYQSKTLWFNALSVAIVLIDQLGKSSVLSPEMAAVIITTGNAVLRLMTKQAITK